MPPKTYIPYPRECKNCKYIYISMPTSCLIKAISITYHCTNGVSPIPKVRYELDSNIPNTEIASIEELEKWSKAKNSWLEKTLVNKNGICNEHKFKDEQ